MAAKRGRNITQMGGLFDPLTIGSGPAVAGQPVMVRMQGVPTMPGYRDRIGKWNFDSVRDWFHKRLRKRIRYELR